MPAPNASRKTAVTASDSHRNLIPKGIFEGIFTESERKSILKLKPDVIKCLPKPHAPGEWDSEITHPKAKDGLPNPIPTPITVLSKDITLSFATGRPLADRTDILKCNHCRRAILRHRATQHVEHCIAKKQEKQRKKKEAKDARDAAARKAEKGEESSESEDAEGEDETLSAKTTRKIDGPQAGQKRKAEDGSIIIGGEKKKKKNKKDEIKGINKLPKPKAPVDVEKQCGVELPQGGQCARSLTCKSHSMGAKRAVPGRSAPYDKLLAEYQRKNQAKLQRAAMDSQNYAQDDMYDDNANGLPVDSDDEKEKVFAAITRARPRPMFQHIPFPLKRKYQHVRLRDMLANALGNTSTTNGQRTSIFAPFASTNTVSGTGMFSHLGITPQSAVLMTANTPFTNPSALSNGGGLFSVMNASGHRGSLAESLHSISGMGTDNLTADLIAAASGGREMEVGA